MCRASLFKKTALFGVEYLVMAQKPQQIKSCSPEIRKRVFIKVFGWFSSSDRPKKPQRVIVLYSILLLFLFISLLFEYPRHYEWSACTSFDNLHCFSLQVILLIYQPRNNLPCSEFQINSAELRNIQDIYFSCICVIDSTASKFDTKFETRQPNAGCCRVWVKSHCCRCFLFTSIQTSESPFINKNKNKESHLKKG